MGVGDVLHRNLKARFGAKITVGCGCKAWIDKMNKNGPAWCRANKKAIVNALRQSARQQKWWKYAAMLPGARLGLKLMVLEAIREVEG